MSIALGAGFIAIGVMMLIVAFNGSESAVLSSLVTGWSR